MKYKAVTIGVLLWAAALLAAVLYLSSEKIKVFDHNNLLSNLMVDMAFDLQLADYLKSQNISLANSVIRFTANDCFCNTVATPHINSVNKLAIDNEYQNITLSIDKYHELSKYIPSVPAVAVFNDNAELSYLGPYSTGMYCSPNKGLVEKFIPSKNNIIGATIINDAKGCYCNLTP